MAAFDVVLRRRWFGEEMEQKLGEYDHSPSVGELLDLARRHGLGGSATLYVRQAGGRGASRDYRIKDLQPPPRDTP